MGHPLLQEIPVESAVWGMDLVQKYLANKNPPPPQVPTVALCLGTYGDPRGVGVSYERGTPVQA